MTFNILVIVLIALVAYFHFVQGFFSSAISAVIAVIAAMLAVSYHESLVNLIFKGSFADEAHAMMLCGIFGITYIVLRTIFDKAIPGNVRTPSTIDKVGAILMGLVVGGYAVGILTIAIQMLPMSPSISWLGYDRYAVEGNNVEVIVPQGAGGRDTDATVNDRLKSAVLKEDETNFRPLWTHVDDLVLGTAAMLSDRGSMAGDRTLKSIHPDYLKELFAERLGQQTGGQRSAVQFKNTETISVVNVFKADSLVGFDAEPEQLRKSGAPLPFKPINPNPTKDAEGHIPALKYEIKPTGGQALIVIRLKLGANASIDTDHFFRFSCGAIRLVAKTGDGYADFFPIGTLENSKTVLLNAADDFLFAKGGDKSSIDAVFLVDRAAVAGGKLAEGTFIAVKRFAVLDLAGTYIKDTIDKLPKDSVIRSQVIGERLAIAHDNAEDVKPADDEPPTKTPSKPAATDTADATKPPETPGTPPPPAAEEKLDAHLEPSGQVPFAVGVTKTADNFNLKATGGNVSLKDDKFLQVELEPADSAENQATGGPTQVRELFVPEGKSALQVSVNLSGGIAGVEAALKLVLLVDSNGNTYQPNGVYVKSQAAGYWFDYGAEQTVDHIAKNVPNLSAEPEKRVTFIFNAPEGTKATLIRIGANQDSFH